MNRNTRLIRQKTGQYLSVLFLSFAVGFAGCDTNNSSSTEGHMQIKLHDAPAAYASVQLDIQKVEVKNSSTADTWVTLNDKPIMVDLLDLTNGNAKVIGSADIAAGTYTGLRLVLGNDNKIEAGGATLNLQLAGGSQSGTEVAINTTIDAQDNAIILLDFDAARSIKPTLTGGFVLDPVVTAIKASESGQISGQISPASAKAILYATSGSDTVATTYADTTSGAFKFLGMKEGIYELSIVSRNTALKDTTLSQVSVQARQETKTGTIKLSYIQ